MPSPEIDPQFGSIEKTLISETVDEASEKMDVSSLSEISADPPWGDREQGGQAFFNPDSVFVDPDSIGMDAKPQRQIAADRKFDLATDQSKGLIAHELAHIGHANEKRSGCEAPNDQNWDAGDNVEAVRREVSPYAATSPEEMVAEVASMRMLGETFSDEVMRLYRKYCGPEF